MASDLLSSSVHASLGDAAGAADAPHRIAGLATARIVFIGNCQIANLAAFYRACFAVQELTKAYYINSQIELSDTDRESLRNAEIVVWQVIDGAAKIGFDAVASSSRVVKIPLVSANFLWPFAGRPHPRNQRTPDVENGPFDPELGDVYLNGLIAQAINREEAVRRYLTLDFSTRTNLDRLFELWLSSQRQRDQACDFETAQYIEKLFRTEQVFLTPHHPNLPLFKYLAGQLFRRIGCDEARIDNVLAALWRSPFAPTSLPIHPAVAHHFRLQWVSEHHRFPIRHEGHFTFPDYVRRYMDYEWNEPLAKGLRATQTGNDARIELQEGLARSPDSAAGHAALAQTFLRLGLASEALNAAQTAVSCDPTHPETNHILGVCLLKCGDVSGAESAFRRALAIHPAYGSPALELGRLLLDQGRLEEAEGTLRRALIFHPDETLLLALAAKILARLNEFDAAESLLRHATGLRPKMSSLRCDLAEVLSLKMQYQVIEDYKTVVSASGDDADVVTGLGQILAAFGRFRDAEEHFRNAVRINPTHSGYVIQLIDCLSRQQRRDEALSLAEHLDRTGAADPRLPALLERLRAQETSSGKTNNPTARPRDGKLLDIRLSKGHH